MILQKKENHDVDNLHHMQRMIKFLLRVQH